MAGRFEEEKDRTHFGDSGGQFIIPMITVTILYIRIGHSLHRREILTEETVNVTEPENHQIDPAR